MAEALGLDFVVLGPVNRTTSHPDATPIGWAAFSEMIRDASLPVYALGGLTPDCIAEARGHGAHGIAMLSGAWMPGRA